MKHLIAILLLASLTGCTYTITMVHTEGQADDVVDETTSNTPTTSVEPMLTFQKPLVGK